MKSNEIENQIKKDWFKDHVAKFTKLSDRVSTLTWSNPNSSFYYIRYVFDGSKLYISGDVGEAIFSFTEKASIESAKTYNADYFHGKLAAFCEEKYSFDSNIAIKRIKQEIKETKKSKDMDNEGFEKFNDYNKESNEYISTLNYLMLETKSCCNTSSWKYEVNKVYDELTNYDCDAAEWIFSAGDIIPMRVQGYLIGLKMAYEQLKGARKC